MIELRHWIYRAVAMAFLLAAVHARGQSSLALTGNIIIKGGKNIPYRLQLTDSSGYIKGYSITYTEPDEARAVVEGQIDRSKKRLLFKERSLVYSNGFHPEALCMISATLDYDPTGKVLKGAITSKDAGNTRCTGGSVVFSSETEVTQLFATSLPKAQPVAVKDDDMVPASAPAPAEDKYNVTITMKGKTRKDTSACGAQVQEGRAAPVVTDKITAGTDKAYTWYSDTVVADIWDSGNIDGDRISIQFNGTTVLAGHYLSREKKQLRLRLSAGENTLAIVADNEGSDPPNTATLLLTDQRKQYRIVAYNPKGGISMIRIRKAK